MSDLLNQLRKTIIEWKKSRHVSYAETLQMATDRIEELEAERNSYNNLAEKAVEEIDELQSRIEELEAENQDLRDSKADMLANHIHATAELHSRIDAALKLTDKWSEGDFNLPDYTRGKMDGCHQCADELRATLQSDDAVSSNQPVNTTVDQEEG